MTIMFKLGTSVHHSGTHREQHFCCIWHRALSFGHNPPYVLLRAVYVQKHSPPVRASTSDARAPYEPYERRTCEYGLLTDLASTRRLEQVEAPGERKLARRRQITHQHFISNDVLDYKIRLLRAVCGESSATDCVCGARLPSSLPHGKVGRSQLCQQPRSRVNDPQNRAKVDGILTCLSRIVNMRGLWEELRPCLSGITQYREITCQGRYLRSRPSRLPGTTTCTPTVEWGVSPKTWP
ncbi:hypothetical protein Bbelb_168010 [Branchiostoma belcheri]|nr:hypothetical protein Bbelb_168010 [Branchiostoma belcheri]